MAEYRRNPDVAWRIVDGQCILVQSELGEVQVLNDVGSFIWEKLDSSRGELLRALVSEYEVDLPSAEADLSAFLKELEESRMVVPA